MIIGIPKELINNENRVSITPAGVSSLVSMGHRVLVETNAGLQAGFPDSEYEEVGGLVLNKKDDVWNKSDMVVKVKEPVEEEYKFFREDLIIFTFLHLSSNKTLTKELLKSKTTAIAYETVEDRNFSLALLTPMSDIAGKVAIQNGAIFLESSFGGKGVLLDGAPGVPPAHVVIVGAGAVGTSALKRAVGFGARVTILDINIDRLRQIENQFMGKVETLYSNEYNLKKVIKTADLVIGSVLIPGRKAPKIITREMIKSMEKGSVVIDVAIDQGGCVETIDKPTTRDNPVFEKYGVIHSAISNLPSSVAKTSTLALTNSTISYIVDIANKGFLEAISQNPSLKKGVNTFKGNIVYPAVGESLDLDYKDIDSLI